MGRLSVKRLDVPRLYSCKQCKSHLAAFDDLISKVSPHTEPANTCQPRGQR